MMYHKEISRKNLMSFKDIEIIEGMTENEIYSLIESYLKEALELADIDTDIVNIQIVGSRTKGTAKETSDLDVLVEYNNEDLREDNLFNFLNDDEEPLIINDIRVDFNPITSSRTGTIEEWLEAKYNYNKYTEETADEEEDEI